MNIELANLRRARVRAHKSIRQAEGVLAVHKERLVRIEAGIFAIAPELKLPAQYRDSNPLFARGELTRLILDELREAVKPLRQGVLIRRVLAAKGLTLPSATQLKTVRKRVSTALWVLRTRKIVERDDGRYPGGWTLAFS